jgi:hypothetical protein
MATSTMICVGCGRQFQGDRSLVPEFTSGGGSIGSGGHMCQQCFNTTNQLNAANGRDQMPMPPAGAWSTDPGTYAPPPVARAAPTPQQQAAPAKPVKAPPSSQPLRRR